VSRAVWRVCQNEILILAFAHGPHCRRRMCCASLFETLTQSNWPKLAPLCVNNPHFLLCLSSSAEKTRLHLTVSRIDKTSSPEVPLPSELCSPVCNQDRPIFLVFNGFIREFQAAVDNGKTILEFLFTDAKWGICKKSIPAYKGVETMLSKELCQCRHFC
jgi:hypothetical protein